jgi:hypothetical protein
MGLSSIVQGHMRGDIDSQASAAQQIKKFVRGPK